MRCTYPMVPDNTGYIIQMMGGGLTQSSVCPLEIEMVNLLISNYYNAGMSCNEGVRTRRFKCCSLHKA